MSSAPAYFAGTQGFGTSWTATNVKQLIEKLEMYDITHYDTAAVYPVTNPGESERILGTLHSQDAIIDTKVLFSEPGALSKEKMLASIKKSLDHLQLSKVQQFLPVVSISSSQTSSTRSILFTHTHQTN